MWIKDICSAIYGQKKTVELHSVRALLLFTSKIWTRPHFLIGLSKHFLSPPTSSGASYLTLGKVSGGAPLILWNFSHGTMCISPTSPTAVSYISYISYISLLHLLHLLHQSPTSPTSVSYISYISYINLLHLLHLLHQSHTSRFILSWPSQFG